MSNQKTIGNAHIYLIDCLVGLKNLASHSVDFIATDPPYFLDGMGDEWSDRDLKEKEAKGGAVRGLPVGMKFDPRQGQRLELFFEQVSREVLRVLKPGGFMVSFSQGRLYHRLAIAGIVGRRFQLFYGNAHDGQLVRQISVCHLIIGRGLVKFCNPLIRLLA